MIARRAGTTLVELLVVLALLIPIWGAAIGLAVHAAGAAVRADGIAAAEATLATAAAIARTELAEMPAGGLLALATDRVRFHATRATGRWCHADSTGLVARGEPDIWGASRLPVPGRDSLWLDTMRVAGATGSWRLSISGVPVPVPCPDTRPGLLLPVTGLEALPAGVVIGPVARTAEVLELAAYLSGGETWLGLRHLGTGELVQPLAGPFAPGGLRFSGLDAAGLPVADLGSVAAIAIHLETAAPHPMTREVRVALPR